MFRRALFAWKPFINYSIRFQSTAVPDSTKYELLKTCTSKRWMYNDDTREYMRQT